MTKRVVLIGHPVAHSLSGAMQQAAFDHAGIDATYELWDRTPLQLADAIAELRTDDFLGANVTIPHKERVVPQVDRLTEEGCAPVRALLRDAVATGRLPADLDVDEAAAELEGPVFYWGLVRHEPVPPDVPARVVDRFLARAGSRRRPGRSPTAHH